MRKEIEVLDLIQGSEEWHEARTGIITASKIAACFTSKLAISKAGIKTTAKNIIVERFKTDEPEMSTYWMQRGNELEPQARKLLSFSLSEEIKEVGFLLDRDAGIGCSPDGLLVTGNAGIEIKCPSPKNQLDYLLEGVVPSKYVPQVQFSMYVSGLSKWHFMSYHPEMRVLEVESERDMEFHEKIKEVIGLLKETMNEYEEIILN